MDSLQAAGPHSIQAWMLMMDGVSGALTWAKLTTQIDVNPLLLPCMANWQIKAKWQDELKINIKM